jgi:hypothetical protein
MRIDDLPNVAVVIIVGLAGALVGIIALTLWLRRMSG